MSSGTALIVLGLLVALAGAGVAVLARARPNPGPAEPVGEELGEELGAATSLEDVARALGSIDRRIRMGVAVAVAGLMLAGVGAYLGSDARALGADVGGGGSNDDARVGGSW